MATPSTNTVPSTTSRYSKFVQLISPNMISVMIGLLSGLLINLLTNDQSNFRYWLPITLLLVSVVLWALLLRLYEKLQEVYATKRADEDLVQAGGAADHTPRSDAELWSETVAIHRGLYFMFLVPAVILIIIATVSIVYTNRAIVAEAELEKGQLLEKLKNIEKALGEISKPVARRPTSELQVPAETNNEQSLPNQ